MFALHETTQRRVCRVTFLTFCVVPTLLTLVGIAFCNRPWRQADWQRTLAQRLHVRATLDEISRPLPGVTELTTLQLADLRTDRPLGSIDKLSFQHQNSRLTLHADHLTLEAEQLPAFVTAVSTWLATGELEPLDFEADRLTIMDSSLRTLVLNDFTINDETTGSQGQHFGLTAFDETGKHIQLVLESEQGRLHFVVDAQQVSLPAWLVGKLVPGVSGCGDATFHGKISATSKNQITHGELQGKFEQVDLQTWIGKDGPHRLQGLAQVDFEQLDWSDGSLELVRGKIEAIGGATSFSLLDAIFSLQDAKGKIFACSPAANWQTLKPATPDTLIPFDQLAFRFQMSSAGMTLAGECANGELLISQGSPLLFGPGENVPFAVAQFVLVFHEAQHGYLPDTRGANKMARELPLPEDEARALEPVQQ